jgi:ceramide glucosyltransferase
VSGPLVQLIHASVTWVGFASLTVAASYGLINLLALLVWQFSNRRRLPPALPPVSVLKPLCGGEPSLYENLRSFCTQDYPKFQVVFGIRDPADPARPVAERLKAEFPHLDINVVIDPQLHGQNFKVSNLINMLPYAKYDLLAMADSDTIVDSRYLAVVTAPLADRNVGLVTCVYRGVPSPDIWSRLGAMYINEWYMPSVLLAWLFGHQGYVSGQTISLTRDTLRSIGGFAAIADHLADDYRLGELVRKSGRRVVLSPYVVAGMHHEPSLYAVTRHEIRWMLTLGVLRPRSFRFLFLTFSLPLAAIGFVLAREASPSAAVSILMTFTVLCRLIVHFVHRLGDSRSVFADLWLLPVRDALICWVWLRSLFSSEVLWRGVKFDVNPEGIMRRL